MISTTLPDWIAQLASGAAEERRAAAAFCYREGSQLGEAAIAEWSKDPEFDQEICGPLTVGIAVHPQRFAAIRAAMGSPLLADVPPDQDAVEFELHLETRFGEIWLDILTTGAPTQGGAIDRYLAKFGEGIQQVEFPVRNVDRATALLRERFAVQPIYPETRNGANGTRVNFFLASTPDKKKVLVEFVQSQVL